MTRLLPTAALVALYLACAIFAPGGAMHDLPPHPPLLPPTLAHPFGTDDLGRDMLAAALQGGRTSLGVAAMATLLALALGVAVGVAAAIAGGALDDALMRGAEIVASLPTLLVAVLVAALFGGSMTALALVIGLTRWPLVARLMRIETLALLGQMHLRAARSRSVWPRGGSRGGICCRRSPHRRGPRPGSCSAAPSWPRRRLPLSGWAILRRRAGVR